MKDLFKKLNKKNINEMRKELARAHIIVVLLAGVVAALVSFGVTQPMTFEPTLSAICVALMLFVMVVSLSTSINLLKKK